ncbi:MAG: ABC transporter permease [Chloroflexota bacterium]|nr:ABC transporter permease [Chloroflexota bacterium]
MRNIWLVIKHEILSTLGKPSFWLMTFLFPLLIVGLQVGSQVLGQNAMKEETSNITPANEPVGYVDQAGLIQTLPDHVPPELLVAFSDEDTAHAALEAGDISGYYMIPADFFASGDLILVNRDYNPFKSMISSDMIRHIVNTNLVGDETLARLIVNPTSQVKNVPLAPQGGTDTNNPMAFIVPYATLFIFFLVITMNSGFMLQSVAKEKENRIIEVLLVSLQPREMMLGKVVGLGAVALLQMALWASVGLLALGRIEAAAAFSLPPGFLVWALFYFLLGYLLYSSLMGALGALAPTMREGQQLTFVVLLPLMIPLWLMNAFIQTPNGLLPTILSLFPLTAPVSMMTRLVATGVPVWQPIIGLILLAATTYLVVVVTARLFRAQTLLSGTTLTPRHIWKTLREQ